MNAGVLLADDQVAQDVLGPDGDSVGGSISPHGQHVAVLVVAGSRFQIHVDGVAGPKIDGLLTTPSASSLFRAPGYWGGQVPVVFSDDGAHCAYMAKVSEEYVVMLDGKELARAPLKQIMVTTLPLTFSSGGKHLFYGDQDEKGQYVVMVDGKPGPAMKNLPNIVFSPNGVHYAYVGEYSRNGQGVWSVADGRQVNFFGDQLQYTPRNVLISQVGLGGTNIFLLNGKPEIKAARFDPMWISKDGAQIAMVITPYQGAQSFLTVNGKTVQGTEGLQISKVYFSPNGKRYAALCVLKSGSKFMIVDGKKQSEYQEIPADIPPGSNMNHWRWVTGNFNLAPADAQPPVPGFSADSSSFVYVAKGGSRQFLVIDDNESKGFDGSIGLEPVLSAVGNRVGVIGVAPDKNQHAIVDGKDTSYGPVNVPNAQRLSQLTFSPGGAHCALVKGQTLLVDNVAQPGAVFGDNYTFSPDDAHFAYYATVNNNSCILVDGKVICDKPSMVNYVFFSTDGKHVYWTSTQNLMGQGTKDTHLLFVDGKPTTHFEFPINGAPMIYEFADDALTFVAITDGKIRRFHVKPQTTLAAALTTAPTPKTD